MGMFDDIASECIGRIKNNVGTLIAMGFTKDDMKKLMKLILADIKEEKSEKDKVQR